MSRADWGKPLEKLATASVAAVFGFAVSGRGVDGDNAWIAWWSFLGGVLLTVFVLFGLFHLRVARAAEQWFRARPLTLPFHSVRRAELHAAPSKDEDPELVVEVLVVSPIGPLRVTKNEFTIGLVPLGEGESAYFTTRDKQVDTPETIEVDAEPVPITLRVRPTTQALHRTLTTLAGHAFKNRAIRVSLRWSGEVTRQDETLQVENRLSPTAVFDGAVGVYKR